MTTRANVPANIPEIRKAIQERIDDPATTPAERAKLKAALDALDAGGVASGSSSRLAPAAKAALDEKMGLAPAPGVVDRGRVQIFGRLPDHRGR